MKGTLYRIFNTINGKSYIGKTYCSLYKRLQEHISLSETGYISRPLYAAINKYGLESFSVETLGEYDEGILEEKEIYYIKTYNSYGISGYNATLGGDGRRYLDLPEDEIIEFYKNNTIVSVASRFNTTPNTIKRVLIGRGTNLRKPGEDQVYKDSKRSKSKKVYLPTLDITFDNVYECAQALIDADIVNTTESTIESIQKGIAMVCSGNRKSYKTLKFNYI